MSDQKQPMESAGVRSHLSAFIHAVQHRMLSDPNYRPLFSITNHGGPTLAFGYGYFSGGKVWVDGPNETGREMTVEEALDVLFDNKPV